jgi:hypothetical protein
VDTLSALLNQGNLELKPPLRVDPYGTTHVIEDTPMDPPDEALPGDESDAPSLEPSDEYSESPSPLESPSASRAAYPSEPASAYQFGSAAAVPSPPARTYLPPPAAPPLARTSPPSVTPSRTPTTQNLAFEKPTSADSFCDGSDSSAMAVDGSTSTQWCSSGEFKWMMVDLGQVYPLRSFIVRHAGAGGQASTYNTKEFLIDTSTDGATWTSATRLARNTDSVSNITLPSTISGRWVRLSIASASQTGSAIARITEFEVYEQDTGGIYPQGPYNVAWNAYATADSSCNAAEDPSRAADGALDYDSKWCSYGQSASGVAWLKIDLGQVYTFRSLRIYHAGVGGESTALNTRDFVVKIWDGANWVPIVEVYGNTASTTSYTLASPVTSRWVCLNVYAGQQDGTLTAHIYDLQVYA